jgi:hypothetical protein
MLAGAIAPFVVHLRTQPRQPEDLLAGTSLCCTQASMGARKISTGPRYQRTGSPTQKHARQLAAIAARVLEEALSSPKRRRPRRAATVRSSR